MGQRLGIATPLLGDPATPLLDEPVNGLDPEGIQWIRQLLRSLAAEGRSVLASSHLMSEMALTADRLTSSAEAGGHRGPRAHPPPSPRPRADVSPQPDGVLVVTGMDARDVGIVAGTAGITLWELSSHSVSLEEAFMELTRDAAEYTTTQGERPNRHHHPGHRAKPGSHRAAGGR